MKEKIRYIACNVAVVLLVSLLLMWGNTWHRQRTQFVKGEAAFSRGDFVEAVAGFESAIHMYTPWSSRVERGAQRLWELGEWAEARGDLPRALIAYRSLRSSFYAVRWLTQPGQEWISRSEGRIAQILERQQAARP